MKKNTQMSETMLLAILITFSGGLQDAYTYFQRNHVFANAQTGNIVLMASNMFDGNWSDAMHYLFPILAFMLGTFVAEQIQGYFKEKGHIHWRQYILIIEIICLFISGFLNENFNVFVNSLVSFSCALQVQTFRSTHGYPYASTMCIGNMRSGVAALSHYCRTKQNDSLIRALHYFVIIIVFAIGAGVGYLCIPKLGIHTIWISSALLLCSFLLMFINKE